MELWTAFLLGLAGSAHCAGMCGPLVVALPAPGGGGLSRAVGRLVYNLGRVLTYGLFGLVFGALGHTLALAGFQRWLSIGAGVAVVVGLLAWRHAALERVLARPMGWLQLAFGPLLRHRTNGTLVLLGALNGLLPCGLVYVACAGAAATGGLWGGVKYMLLFGLGTVPMMLSLGLAGAWLHGLMRRRLQWLAPVALGVLAALLILRGLALGIPSLSPDLSGSPAHSPACHHAP